MRLLTFDKSGARVLAVRRGTAEIVDLAVALPDLPADVPGLLAAGDEALDAVRLAAEDPAAEAVLPSEGLTYHPAVWNPGKIVCVGLNYAAHAAEAQSDVSKAQEYPSLFLRVSTTLVGHEQPLLVPKQSTQLDYEGEMVVVIGKTGSYVPRDKALDLVAAYSVFNEASVRDFQFKSPQWTAGKNFNATGGFGPDLVTADELPPGASGLNLRTHLNGETLQDANTDNMIFDVPTLIEIITEVMTLHPGDIIVTGTPEGVGFARDPQVWMKPGDSCEVEIEGIGLLRNPIAAAA